MLKNIRAYVVMFCQLKLPIYCVPWPYCTCVIKTWTFVWYLILYQHCKTLFKFRNVFFLGRCCIFITCVFEWCRCFANINMVLCVKMAEFTTAVSMWLGNLRLLPVAVAFFLCLCKNLNYMSWQDWQKNPYCRALLCILRDLISPSWQKLGCCYAGVLRQDC